MRAGEDAERGVWVEVTRGAAVESRHRIHVAVVDAAGRPRAAGGDPIRPTFARSAIKALQALPLVADGVAERYGLTDAELALCCASHGGEPIHVEAAASMLAKIGVEADALACGPHAPFHTPSAKALAAAGAEPGRLHNNCSGKHAGMLALARAHGWPLEGYHRAEHPVQQRMRAEFARWTGMPEAEVETAADGCGVVTFAAPLTALARAFARLSEAARSGEAAPARLVGALARHPEYVAGTDRLCTDLLRATEGRVFAKFGAEGVYCAGIPASGLGVALKAEDGAKRAAESALVGVLRELGAITPVEAERLARHGEPELRNTLGEVVGRIRPVVRLETCGG